MEKHRSYRGPLVSLPSGTPQPQYGGMGGFHTPIHYTYFKLSISSRRLPFGLAARIRRKGSGWIAIGTTMRPYKRRGILGSNVDYRQTALPFSNLAITALASTSISFPPPGLPFSAPRH